MGQSEQIGELAAALAKAQAVMTAVGKGNRASIQTKSGGSYSYAYADLASIFDMLRKPLSDNGLAIMQMPYVAEGIVSVDTVLAHSSGQWVSCTVAMRAADGDPKAVGSAITYGRRYGLSLIGAVTDEDDDGDRASTSRQQRQPAAQPHHDNGPDWDDIENLPQAGQPKPTNGTTNDGPKMATDKQVGMMGALVKEMYPKAEDMESFRAWLKQSYNVTSRKELTLKQASEVIDMLTKMKNGEQVAA